VKRVPSPPTRAGRDPSLAPSTITTKYPRIAGLVLPLEPETSTDSLIKPRWTCPRESQCLGRRKLQSYSKPKRGLLRGPRPEVRCDLDRFVGESRSFVGVWSRFRRLLRRPRRTVGPEDFLTGRAAAEAAGGLTWFRSPHVYNMPQLQRDA
jgi:hypothetical protein